MEIIKSPTTRGGLNKLLVVQTCILLTVAKLLKITFTRNLNDTKKEKQNPELFTLAVQLCFTFNEVCMHREKYQAWLQVMFICSL